MKNTQIFPRRLALGLILVAGAFGSGCGATSEALRGDGPEDPMATRDKFGSVVQLTVQNNDFKDATIYAISQRGVMPELRMSAKFGQSSASVQGALIGFQFSENCAGRGTRRSLL